MDQAELISVIVPVYKVEKYLDRCVQSIVDQTYRNLEIILVDDGSPDNCPAMCDAWAAKDNRIKVIHKKNGGLSDARNAGMEVATGDLLGFVDSDDYISPEMYQRLYERMKADGSDIAACGVEMVFEDGTQSRSLTLSGDYVLDTMQAMEAIIRESYLKQPVWYKLYKTEQIRDILFPVGKYHEDVFWSYQAVARAEKVSIFDQPCYFYTQRSGSIMGASFSLKRFDGLEAKRLRLDFINEKFPSLGSLTRIDLWYHFLYLGQMSLLYMSKEEQKKAFDRILAIKKEYPLAQSDMNVVPMKQRVWMQLSNFSFVAACKLRNRLKIGI